MDAPVNVHAPNLTGHPNVSDTLRCTMGEWDGAPTAYSYGWTRDGTAFGAADEPVYGLVQADRGATIACVVTASNDGGSTEGPPSNAIGPIGDPRLGVSPDGLTLVEEQLQRSAAIESMGVDAYKKLVDERP